MQVRSSKAMHRRELTARKFLRRHFHQSVLSQIQFCECVSVNVRFAPMATELLRRTQLTLRAITGCEQSQQTLLFDHLVGEGDQLIRHMEAKHFGDLAVDLELEVYLASG
jgi:hypothetical protein